MRLALPEPSRLLAFLSRILLALALFAGLAQAWAEPDFLEPEKAFQFSVRQIAADRIEVHYQIAAGYYMYRERFKFSAVGAKLGSPVIPAGAVHFDETFQKDVETYRNSVTIQIPVLSVDNPQSGWTFNSRGQGCSDQGLCYAPLDSSQHLGGTPLSAGSAAPPEPVQQAAADPAGSDSSLQQSLQSGRLILIVPLFLVLGLGLAFTPCVLPMVPILSSIIVGEGQGVSRHRGLLLSLSYSLGMAIVYTALGVAAGLLGEGLAAALQNPWVLGSFGTLLVLLSLSMFNVYHLQVPHAVQTRLSHISGRQRGGKLLGVFVMGAVSALIVGPCVAAPLASALLYISQTHNVVTGGTALFSMAIGMSVPLILVGISAGTLLPRAGRWMEAIKQLFGVLMLAMALWLTSPVLPVSLQKTGWMVLMLGYAYVLLRKRGVFPKLSALALGILGALQVAGLALHQTDVWWLPGSVGAQQAGGLQFQRVATLQDLDLALSRAQAAGQYVMLDFYADWCVSCKEMEHLTFTQPAVAGRLGKLVLLQADVTANSDADKALLKRFRLFGPPGMIFFGPAGMEAGRVIGFENPDQFTQTLNRLVKL